LKGGGEGAGTAKLNTGIPTTFITAAADQLSSQIPAAAGKYTGEKFVSKILRVLTLDTI